MTGKVLLLVEDDLEVQGFNTQLLEHEGFAVRAAATLAEARGKMESGPRPDAMILDIGMPDGSGLDFLRETRENSNIPVLMLTGYTANEDVVRGFQSGCDDYLAKPYEFKVLLVRILRLLKNAGQVPDRIVAGSGGDIVIEVPRSKASINGRDLALGEKKEFALFVHFALRENQVLTLGQLYEKVWGMPLNKDTTAVRNAIRRLREKLDGSGYTVESSYGNGYYFTKARDFCPRALTPA